MFNKEITIIGNVYVKKGNPKNIYVYTMKNKVIYNWPYN
jgi:hypothetical protein